MTRRTVMRLAALVSLWAAAGEAQPAPLACGTFRGRPDYELAVHRYEAARLRSLGLAPGPTSVTAAGNIAIMEANGGLIHPANVFDLENEAVAFTPIESQGYSVSRDDSHRVPASGRTLVLSTNRSAGLDLPFPFPFYGTPHTRLFVNANGSLTFSQADPSWTAGSEAFLTTIPRIAVFFADLDLREGGRVVVDEKPDRIVVSWTDVPELWSTHVDTFQVVLEPSGRIVMRYGKTETPSALVGVSFPYSGADTDLVDLSEGGSGRGAVFEEFRTKPLVDRVETVRRFLAAYPDVFDYIVLWTTFDSDTGDAIAFEATVRNDAQGIGQSVFDVSRSWGSAGRLRSVLMMGSLSEYPERPQAHLRRSDMTSLEVVSHETAHLWLAYVYFIDGDSTSDALLASQVHWSFFQDSDASFMYGNDIALETAERFRTIETFARFSQLDLYLMGLAPAAEVGPVLLIKNGRGRDGNNQPLTSASYPERGVAITGSGEQVLLDAIVRAEGPREPPFETSPKSFRQAWLLVHLPGAPPTARQIGQVDDLRAAFQGYFQSVTLGRGVMVTTLP